MQINIYIYLQQSIPSKKQLSTTVRLLEYISLFLKNQVKSTENALK